jgi:hypothetical protein
MEVSGQLHAPAALFPREKASGTNWIGGWVGNQWFRSLAAAIFRVEVRDHEDVSTALLPTMNYRH